MRLTQAQKSSPSDVGELRPNPETLNTPPCPRSAGSTEAASICSSAIAALSLCGLWGALDGCPQRDQSLGAHFEVFGLRVLGVLRFEQSSSPKNPNLNLETLKRHPRGSPGELGWGEDAIKARKVWHLHKLFRCFESGSRPRDARTCLRNFAV